MKLPRIPERPADGHKGDFGKILVIGGSLAMPGAAGLAGLAALKAGAGLVKVATPAVAVAAVAGVSPCYTFLPCPENPEGGLAAAAIQPILDEAKNADVLAIGPGITTHQETGRVVQAVIEKNDRPLVIDADGLNLAAQDIDTLIRRKAPALLTPHPGEFQRLAGKKPPADKQGRITAATELAKKLSCLVVLKGKGTVVADDRSHWVNDTGNPGMATAGSGDVLTGMLASLTALLGPSLETTALAVHLHGLAGDLAARNLGEVSVTAWDILHFLPAAIVTYQRGCES